MLTLVCLADSITAKERDSEGILKLTLRLQQNLAHWKIINAGVGAGFEPKIVQETGKY